MQNNHLEIIEKKYEIEISKFKQTFKIPENEKIKSIKLTGGGLLGDATKIKIVVNLKK